MQILKVKSTNLKGKGKKELDLTSKVVIIGPNGSGKTGMLKTVEIAITGYDSEIGKKPNSVMEHIHGNQGSVSITVKDGDTVSEIKRVYKRDRKGSVGMGVSVLPKEDEQTSKDYEARIKNLVGSFPMMFDLNSFINMTDTEFRNFFFWKCKEVGWDKKKIFDKMKKDTEGLIGDAKKECEDIIKQTEEDWDELLTAKDNLEVILEYLRTEKNEASSEIRGNVGASESIEEKKEEDLTSKTIPSLKTEIARNENELRKLSAEMERNRGAGELYETTNKDIEVILKRISELPKEFDPDITFEEYTVKMKDVKEGVYKINKAIIEMELELSVIGGQCPIGIKCEELQKRKSERPKIEESLQEVKEELKARNEELDKYERMEGLAYNNEDWTKQLKELQEKMKNLSKPVSNDELKEQEGSISKILEDLKAELEQKIKIQVAETLQANIKLKRVKMEARLDAIKSLQDVVGKDGILGDIIKAILKPYTATINQLLKEIDVNKNIKFKLEDELTGKAIFQFGWQKANDCFVPYHALSNGEKALFGVAIMVALILQQEPKLKVLLVDNIEAVDDDHRVAFIDACCKFVDKKKIDNLIMAGCIQECHAEYYQTWVMGK